MCSSRLTSLIFLLVTAGFSIQAQTAMDLESLGQAVVPYNKMVQGAPVGGLSGITYDRAKNKFYVISDDRSEYASARFYSFRLNLTHGDSLESNGIQWLNKIILKHRNGKPYAEGLIDPEGISLGPDSLIYVASEGDPRINAAPFVNGYDLSGRLVRELPISRPYWSDEKSKKDWGVRLNLGFEGLAASPDGSKLYAALENALTQDGPTADSSNTSPARIIVYDMPAGRVQHEFWYSVDSVFRLPSHSHGFAVNGLTDLLVLDNDGNILTLERNFVQGQGNRIRLYRGSTRCAADVKDMENLHQLQNAGQPVAKWLVADLADFGITIDNFEGMTFGPELQSGGRLLLMVSDNNFSSSQQTIFTAFRIRR